MYCMPRYSWNIAKVGIKTPINQSYKCTCIDIFFMAFLFLFSGAKSLPIHCVVEQTNGPVTFEDDGSSHYTVELDSYAILPCTTLFSELVRAALVKLGYNSTESMNAKG